MKSDETKEKPLQKNCSGSIIPIKKLTIKVSDSPLEYTFYRQA